MAGYTTTLCRQNATQGASTEVTSQDLQKVLQEVKALQAMIQEQRSQSYHMESLTRSVSAQSAQLENRLQAIESHVSKISGLENLLQNVRDFLHTNPALKGVVTNLETLVQQSTPIVRDYKYYILGTLLTMGIIWKYRATLFYERTSEEVADLARRTLEQESLRVSIQETLQTVANNPSTLHTLNDLVQKLITHERTQKDLVDLVVHAVNTPEVQEALLDLLQVVFQDPNLQQLAGEFLLKGLDIDSVKAMLDAQTQELVRTTVADDSVQQATAVGIQRSLWYAVTPPFLWRFIEHRKSEKDVEKQAKENSNGDQEQNKDEGGSNHDTKPNAEYPSQ